MQPEEEANQDQISRMDSGRILQEKRERMEGIMRHMKTSGTKIDQILLNSIVRCYASLGEINEMFQVVHFLEEKESIRLNEVTQAHSMLATFGRLKRFQEQLFTDALLGRTGESDR